MAQALVCFPGSNLEPKGLAMGLPPTKHALARLVRERGAIGTLSAFGNCETAARPSARHLPESAAPSFGTGLVRAGGSTVGEVESAMERGV
mmetsp:Transcript_12505/g.34541  ORF Transcript_12505/g.34541 Transcript_12505/m.34541 type:complete len:91 (+) Transcript_12505:1135-1407(+)